jgi:hypothetical protein
VVRGKPELAPSYRAGCDQNETRPQFVQIRTQASRVRDNRHSSNLVLLHSHSNLAISDTAFRVIVLVGLFAGILEASVKKVARTHSLVRLRPMLFFQWPSSAG